jgi:maltose/moltooligosaccharide transporter
MSDNTWNRLGRRRPYFLTGAILASLALLIMPNSPLLWVAAGMLWVMDASIKITMEPFRAFVGDMLPSEQRTKGFAMQSFFIGTGAVVASALPYMLTNWLGIANTAPEGEIPPSVKYSFYLGAAAFFGAVLWTVLRTKEYSPDELRQHAKAEGKTVHNVDNEEIANPEEISKVFLRRSMIWISAGVIIAFLIYYFHLLAELYIFSGGIALFGILMLVSGALIRNGNTKNGFAVVMYDMYKMPPTMKQLAVVQFFSWFALFAMWIYTTAAVTKHIYGTTDPTSALFNKGADWVGVCFAIYNGFAAIMAFLLPVIARRTSRKFTHMISLIAGGIGLISIYFIKNPDLLLLSMVGVGVAWASILSMPYAILTGSLPSQKMGTYMGIFNFFIVIPQILAASILGFFTRDLFKGEAIFALVLGGISMFIAATTVMLVKDVDEIKTKAKDQAKA